MRPPRKNALLAVDPGVKTAGAAFFVCGKLNAAWLAQADNWWDTASEIRSTFYEYELNDYAPLDLVVEVPQVYVGSKQKGRQKDIIDVALMAGMFLGVFRTVAGEITVLQPAQWKGQVKKEVMERRILERLSDYERARIEVPKAKRKLHNIHDSVGLGLYRLGRL